MALSTYSTDCAHVRANKLTCEMHSLNVAPTANPLSSMIPGTGEMLGEDTLGETPVTPMGSSIACANNRLCCLEHQCEQVFVANPIASCRNSKT